MDKRGELKYIGICSQKLVDYNITSQIRCEGSDKNSECMILEMSGQPKKIVQIGHVGDM